ncbi:hypothetical protein JCM9492_12400 [Aquifex pyrophilus]
MIPGGLNLLYLPPFSIIARFFITALLFLNLFSLFLMLNYARETLYLTPAVHLFTLGFMANTMIGALFQMLPVVAGAVIENPLRKATIVHVLLSLGTLLFTSGLFSNHSFFTFIGYLLLISGFLYVVPYMVYKLLKVENLRDAPRGFIFALLSFLAGLLFATLLVLNLTLGTGFDHAYLLDTHLSFMLFGWTTILVASVSFQVVEMFFVTKPYPPLITRYLPPFVFLLLLLKIILPENPFIDAFLSFSFMTYAFITAERLYTRRRKIRDPLINLWYMAMFFLILSAMHYPFREEFFLTFLTTFGLFAFSIIMAMMYRIIPFLVWMHLSTKGIPKAPTMHEVIKPKYIWANFYLHVAFTLSLLLVPFGIYLPSLILLILDTVLFLLNISRGVFLYYKLYKEKARGIS